MRWWCADIGLFTSILRYSTLLLLFVFYYVKLNIRIGVLLEFVSAFRNRVDGACCIVGSGGCGIDARSGYEILGCCLIESLLSDCRTCVTCRCISVSCCRVF